MQALFPKKLALINSALMIVLITGLVYAVTDALGYVQRIHKSEIPALEMSAIAVNMADSLSRKLEIIAMTGKQDLVEEYRFERDGFEAHLEDFRNVVDQLSGLHLSKSYFDRSQLNAMEESIIRQALAGKTDSAIQALNSKEHTEMTIATKSAIQDLLETLAQERDQVMALKARNLKILLVCAAGMLVLLGFLWWKVWIAYNFNVKAKKEAEDLLEQERAKSIQSSKMVTLGEMAGGIAHEINNPLAIIQGNADQLIRMIQAETPAKDQIEKKLGRIVFTCDRIAKIIKGLRNFSRNADADPFVPSSLTALIQEAVELASGNLKRNDAKLKLELPATDVTVSCRQVQISQILLNLIGNASDAVKTLPDRWIQVSFEDLGDGVNIYVTDSGSGIPKNVAEKMFQPFFTTKKIGEGTGLGLSISIGIAKDHGGSLTLDQNHPNTRFVLHLLKVPAKEVPRAA